MRITEMVTISLATVLLAIIIPTDALQAESTTNEKQNRHVRAIEAASAQPQQQQGAEQQESQSGFIRSGETDFMDEPLKLAVGDQRLSRLMTPVSLDRNRYFFPTSDLFSGRLGGRWLQGSVYPRVGKADSNFIRFGRSFGAPNIKKNNFIRLGRENPRQTNFIRLGRSGPWDSSERFFPKIGFFPDYYSMGSHWSRPKDLALNHDIPTYDDGYN